MSKPTVDQRILATRRLGVIDYAAAWELQRELAAQRAAEAIPDTLLLLEHPPTYTIGRSGGHDHLLVAPAELAARGATLVEVDRGGDITYHGPGQLVGYPILQIKNHGRDLHRYLRMLEQVIIDVLATYDLAGRRFPGYTGVWVGDEKIAAIGIRVNARGVTSHGFALNVATELADFAAIVPCGIADYGVTSLARLLPAAPTLDEVAGRVVPAFERVFDVAATI
ncbi:MAG TPA: lipoyl(octanoyl) transferase LipB [Herpetosiphonaceae bacterium]|nr:lipoyl(octanoyl) transferase LipB [Herpetosiphonaceae bacterium]